MSLSEMRRWQDARLWSPRQCNYLTHQWVWSYFHGNELIMAKSFSSSWLIHEVVLNVDNHFMNHWQTWGPNTWHLNCFLSWWASLSWCGVSPHQQTGVQMRSPCVRVSCLSHSTLVILSGIARLLLLVIRSCPTLCNPLDCSLPGSSIHGDSSGKNTGLGCHFFLQGIFLNQGLNLGLLHYRQNLYHLGPQESPCQALTLHKHLMIINELMQQVTLKLSGQGAWKDQPSSSATLFLGEVRWCRSEGVMASIFLLKGESASAQTDMAAASSKLRVPVS